MKEEQREGKKISTSEKVRMEEELVQRFRGISGMAGKEHSATGPKFLQTLVKSKKDGNYDLPPWEDRCVLFGVNARRWLLRVLFQDLHEGGIGQGR